MLFRRRVGPWGHGARSNKGMKLTKPERNGALQLIPGVGQTVEGVVRRGVLTGLVLASLACDTMISDRFIITTPADTAAQHASTLEVVGAVRETLAECGLRQTSSSGAEVWVWNDPEHPPGVHATVTASGNRVNVRLAQGLYGPIGPTDKYRVVKESLLKNLRHRYGKANVDVE